MLSVARRIKGKLIKMLARFKKIVPVNIPVYHSDLLMGRVAVITGGTSGIGFEIACAFLRSGATVVITGRYENRIEQSTKELLMIDSKYENRVFGSVLDVSNIKNLDSSLSGIIDMLGKKKIDILVNNAGILKGDNFSNVSPKDYDEVLNTNLKGVFFLSQYVSKYMVENDIKGNILNIGSSSKWGVRGLTLGMAKALAPHGIVVNGLAPGPTATPMLMKGDCDGIEHYKIPSQRYSTSVEIANFSVILVSSLSRSIIGDIIYMTGGAGNLTIDDIEYNF